jgi:DNA ligase (NAD+)
LETDIGLIKKRIEHLKAEIEHHNYAYFVLASPEITDTAYDTLFRTLVELEEKYPELSTPDSPTKKVGTVIIDGFQTLRHTVPMLSLDNTYNEQDIKEFHNRVCKILGNASFSYLCELKIDGVSFAARFEDGAFVTGISRGNGIEGEDITEHIRRIPSFPLKLRQKVSLEVRGEVYMPKASFVEINTRREEEGEPLFANPRNAAAGTLRQLDTSVVAKRGLNVFLYHLLDPLSQGLSTQENALQWLTDLGLRTEAHRIRALSIDEVTDFWHRWIEKRHELPFDIDGAVIKVNEYGFYETLGTTTHSPRWAIAFKFPAEQKETVITSVAYSVGRTGVITPVANLAPVHLAGTIVKRASLHNFEYIRDKDIRLGDTVIVEKAGDIIPQIVSAVTEKRTGKEVPLYPPAECPVCSGITGKPREEDVAIRCLNPLCPAKLKRSLEIFVSRQGMNIEGLGERWINEFVERKFIKTIPDIYRLDMAKLVALPRMGEKSAGNLIREIERSKRNPLHQLLTGLGIPMTGVKTAKELARSFRNMRDLKNATEWELRKVEGIGEEMARAIRGYFENPSVTEMLEELAYLGITMEEPIEQISEKLKSLTFVITGTFEGYTREEIKALIEKNGGKVSESVSRKTSYLILGENPGSKYQKAIQYGIPILNEKQWRIRVLE